MNLIDIEEILKENNILVESNFKNNKILGLTYDSRKVEKDFLFFCKGVKFKEDYLNIAINNGANCYISENKYSDGINYFIVKDMRKAMAVISCKYYNYAFNEIETIAITGTKGKTTVAYYIKNIVDEYIKRKSAIISTVEIYTGKRSEDSHLTTPEAPILHELFNEVKESKLNYLTMEVTSQAYKTLRVDGVKFVHGLFLNVSEDHISDAEHCDFEDYLNCKLDLIRNSKDMILNKDMEFFEVAKNECEKNNILYATYGKNKNSDYIYYKEEKIKLGFKFIVENKAKKIKEEFSIIMPGRFNIENAVAAIALSYELGFDTESIKKGLLKTTVMGRMNVFEKDGITVIVDYAHNNLSFTKLYESIKLDYKNRNIISLGGAPGGKAYKRREDFAKIVGEGSSHLVLTAEDPQFEQIEDICNEIISYLPENCEYEIIQDRKKAVEETLQNAKAGDVIILLAKGEEEYQKVNGNFVYYESDLKIVKRLFNI